MLKQKLLLPLLVLTAHLFAQPYIPAKGKAFNDAILPRVDITIDPDSLNEIFNNVFSDHEYPADFLFTDANGSSAVSNVGFRLRGNTSRTAAKKSFKVSFNSFNKKQKFDGLEKMNLNGEHNDPSITRSKLFWETATKLRMPYSRSNHVELYINQSYYGLYINVEHSDENFLQARYLNNSGNFYKCLYPADLAYLGTNPNNYKLAGSATRVYDLMTNTANDDYSDLRNFIVALHAPNSPNYQANLEKLFNVNAFLRAYAFDVLTGNWDNYGGNQNNYYLYHNPETGKIDYLTYDVDNTYGIDFLGQNWGTRNIYNWALDTANRPLVTRLFAYPEYRNRFSYFMKKMIQSYASVADLTTLSNSIKNLVSNSVFTDPYHGLDYGYTYYDFLDSYTQAIGGHAPYGIQDYVAARNTSANTQLILNNVAPIFSETRHNPFVPYVGDSVFIKSWVEDESPINNVFLYFKWTSTGILDSLLMVDDGLHKEDAAGDGIFGAGIPGTGLGDTLYYYLKNTDAFGSTGREPRSGYLSTVVKTRPQLFINEFMAKNTSTITDNFGEFEDWVEIYNTGPAWDMSAIYLSDEFENLGKWNVGDTTLAAFGYFICWADENGSQGANHANFKLSATGERLALSEFNGASYRILDSLTYGAQIDNQSQGCYPDATRPIVVLQPPSPGNSNMIASVRTLEDDNNLSVYPNPVHHFLYLEKNDFIGSGMLKLTNEMGSVLFTQRIVANGNVLKTKVNVESLPAGLYHVQFISATKICGRSFVKE